MKKTSIIGTTFLLILAIAIQFFYSSCNKEACENLKCWNGGNCVDGSCVCASGWEGSICTTPVANADPCLNIVCQNGGDCVNGTCNCTTGYEGTNCETEIRSKYVRTWSVNENCTESGLAGYSTIVTNGSTILSVNIANFWNEFTTINATVNGDTITIPYQFHQSGITGYYIAGNGIWENNMITWTYSITDTITNITNTCATTWQ